MALPKVLHGGRCMVLRDGQVVGSFSGINYQVAYDVQAAVILGRATPAELAYTGVEPVTGTLSGWRVVDHGPHAGPGLPLVQDIFTAEYITLTVFDRVTNREVGSIESVRLGGASGGFAPRQLSEMGIPFQGLIMSDETAQNAEGVGAPDLP